MLRVWRLSESPVASGALLGWLQEKPFGCALPLPAPGLAAGKGGSGTKAGESELPIPAQRGGKSILILHTEILGMESCPGWQDSPGWVLLAALVLLFHPSLGVLIRENLPGWMLLFLGLILFLGAVSSTQDPAVGWFGSRAEGSLLPLSGGIAQGAGRLVRADDGMLGAGPWLLAGAMRFGSACDVGLGQAGLSAGFGSSVAVGRATAACWGSLSLREATALLGDRSLRHRRGQHSPDLGGWLLVPWPLHQACEQLILLLLGQRDTNIVTGQGAHT